MPRRARVAPGGYAYHVLNRANGRLRLLRKEGDFLAFERVLAEAAERVPGCRLLGWCLMGNHWHFLVWPRREGELSAFFRWLTHTHAQRWHAAHGTAGTGHVYQGRFKSFPIEQDHHLLTVLRYAHRNPVRAKLVRRAERWRWSSLWVERHGTPEQQALLLPADEWPVDRPANWLEIVNEAPPAADAQSVLTSLRRSAPFGSPAWTQRTAARLGLDWTLRPRGRPKKESRPL
jgi:putative transposase